MVKNRFKPMKTSKSKDWFLICRRGRGDKITYTIFKDVIVAEYALRELVQREAMIQQRIHSARKAKMIESDGRQSDIDKWDAELKEIRVKYSHQTRVLYEAESLVPSQPLKRDYDSLRRDPRWYMRKELVEDCTDQGGCCSRNCGCCAQRHSHSYQKGIGHCTVECSCCLGFRGFELSTKEKEDTRNGISRRLKSWNPWYLVKMADAFFTEP